MRQYIKVIGALTLDELKDFASTLLRRMRVTLLVGGNIDEAGARAAAAVVKDTLAPLALDPSQIPYSRAVMLPPGNRLHHFPGFNEADDNGVSRPAPPPPELKAGASNIAAGRLSFSITKSRTGTRATRSRWTCWRRSPTSRPSRS